MSTAVAPAPPLAGLAVASLVGILLVQWLPSLWPVSVTLPLALLTFVLSAGMRGHWRLVFLLLASM